MNNVILHSTNCPKCRVLEQKLKEHDIKFTVNYDVHIMSDMGIEITPMLQMNGNLYDFNASMDIIRSYE